MRSVQSDVDPPAARGLHHHRLHPGPAPSRAAGPPVQPGRELPHLEQAGVTSLMVNM